MQDRFGTEISSARHVLHASSSNRSVSRAGTICGLAVGLVAGVLGLGFFHPFGDPRGGGQKDLGAALIAAHVPRDARSVLMAKCADCHSDETHWPLYAHVAPSSWLVEWDVIEGRKRLNLSHFDELTRDEQQLAAAQVAQQVRSGKMPPLKYVALHWNARLSNEDVKALSSMDEAVPEESADTPGDASRGKTIFEKRCTGCHSMSGNGEGPKLAGVYSRKAGTIPTFDYSPALKKSGIVWTDGTLDKWLSDPDRMAPGTTMELRVVKAEDRRDLIAYLKQK